MNDKSSAKISLQNRTLASAILGIVGIIIVAVCLTVRHVESFVNNPNARLVSSNAQRGGIASGVAVRVLLRYAGDDNARRSIMLAGEAAERNKRNSPKPIPPSIALRPPVITEIPTTAKLAPHHPFFATSSDRQNSVSYHYETRPGNSARHSSYAHLLGVTMLKRRFHKVEKHRFVERFRINPTGGIKIIPTPFETPPILDESS